jgi:hypothetical protein
VLYKKDDWGETLAKGGIQDVAKQKLMSPREFALEQGLNLLTVYHKIWDGRLTAEKIDGRWMVLVDEQPKARERKTR